MHIQSKSSSSSIGKSNHVSRCIPIFLAKARTSSVIPTPPKPRSSKSDSYSISNPNESTFIFVEIMGGSLPFLLMSSTWRKERRVSYLGFRWWKKAWVAHRSHHDLTRRNGMWATSTSRASATTTTAKVTQWNPIRSTWPTTCSDSISPPLVGPLTPPSSSTMATSISLSTRPVGSTIWRILRLMGFATSMISCLAFLTK